MREPPALAPEYHKARKQAMLWAGILFVWELIGIDLEKAKDAGGNLGAFIASIRSRQAIPWVFIVLAAYFLFKTWIEWNQCELRRRTALASRIDYRSAWVVTFLAVILSVYQSISRTQVADVVQGSHKLKSFVLGLAISLVAARLLFRIKVSRVQWWKRIVLAALLAIPTIIAIVFFYQGEVSFRYFIPGLSLPIVAVFVLRNFLPRATLGKGPSDSNEESASVTS